LKVKINIDRLVLEGFSYHDHLRISRAMEHELVRLVRENGLKKGAYDLPVVDAGAFNIGQNASPRSIGVNVAQSVYRSLGQQNA
jgi:hypothetical protein